MNGTGSVEECYRRFKRYNKDYVKIATYDEGIWSRFKSKARSKYNHIDGHIIQTSVYNPSRSCTSSFETWLKEVKREEENIPYTFQKVYKRLARKKLAEAGRKNADLREFKVYNDFYMVKDYFTSGLKTVQPGDQHVLVTTNKHLDLFFPREQLSVPDGYFPDAFCEDDIFARSKIRPYDIRILLPGRQYILISPKKSVFFYKVYDADEYKKVFIDIDNTF